MCSTTYCRDCGVPFQLGWAERDYYDRRGIARVKRCQFCRKQRRRNRSKA